MSRSAGSEGFGRGNAAGVAAGWRREIKEAERKVAHVDKRGGGARGASRARDAPGAREAYLRPPLQAPAAERLLYVHVLVPDAAETARLALEVLGMQRLVAGQQHTKLPACRGVPAHRGVPSAAQGAENGAPRAGNGASASASCLVSVSSAEAETDGEWVLGWSGDASHVALHLSSSSHACSSSRASAACRSANWSSWQEPLLSYWAPAGKQHALRWQQQQRCQQERLSEEAGTGARVTGLGGAHVQVRARGASVLVFLPGGLCIEVLGEEGSREGGGRAEGRQDPLRWIALSARPKAYVTQAHLTQAHAKEAHAKEAYATCRSRLQTWWETMGGMRVVRRPGGTRPGDRDERNRNSGAGDVWDVWLGYAEGAPKLRLTDGASGNDSGM
jgi:hypothetical protein